MAATALSVFDALVPLDDQQGDLLPDGRDQAHCAQLDSEADRARKRARSIQNFADPSDSDEDEQDRLPCYEAVLADDEEGGASPPAHHHHHAQQQQQLQHHHHHQREFQDVDLFASARRPWGDMDGSMVPATPMPVLALQPGALALMPSFCPARLRSCCSDGWIGSDGNAATPVRASQPSQVQASCAYVAVCENANGCFRPYMEDRAAHIMMDGVLYTGVYDGHGGAEASCYLQAHLLRNVHARLTPGADVHGSLQAAFLDTNEALRRTGSGHGSTATAVVVNGPRLLCANVGDSPAFVIMKSGEVFSLTHEHKIEGAELQRVTSFGVPIYRNPAGPAYMGTADGTRWLNMSRAFGDFVYPAISCDPHVCTLDVADAKCLVIGSDGLTEKWPIAHVASFVAQAMREGRGLQETCRGLVDQALARGSTDNVTALLVDLEAYMAASHQQQQQLQRAASQQRDAPAAGGGCLEEQQSQQRPVSGEEEEDEVAVAAGAIQQRKRELVEAAAVVGDAQIDDNNSNDSDDTGEEVL